jgi:hypothetical protein
MRLSKFSERFEKDVRELAAALGKLEEGQGRIARNNARGDVRRVLDRVRVRMDAAFPVVPKSRMDIPMTDPLLRAARKSSATKAQRAARQALKLKHAGWGEVMNKDLVVGLAEAGVRVRRLTDGRLFAPKWGVYALLDRPLGMSTFNVKKAEECRRSIKARKALLAAQALGASQMKPAGGGLMP